MMDACELCERSGLELTEHHLVPRDRGGRKEQTAWLCRACHAQVHALFTNKELATDYNSIHALRKEERMSRFLKWIKKQKSDRKVRVRKTRDLRRKKKR